MRFRCADGLLRSIIPFSGSQVFALRLVALAYLGGGDTKRGVDATNGIGSHTDMLSRHWDVPSVETNAITPANAPEIVRMPRKKNNPPDSPIEAAMQPSDGLNSVRDHTDGLSARKDTHCIENNVKRL